MGMAALRAIVQCERQFAWARSMMPTRVRRKWTA